MEAIQLIEKYPSLLKKYGITTPLRKAHLFAQLKHESGLKPIQENLNYSVDGLLSTFKKYFNSITAAAYAKHPEKIANLVYANRMGNGNEASGDGWKYRGRGFLQTTGKANYKALQEETGTDYITSPDLLLNEPDALISSLIFWNKNNLNKYADLDDITTITKKINGGLNGIIDRKNLLVEYKKQFK